MTTTYSVRGRASHTVTLADYRQVAPARCEVLVLDPDWESWSDLSSASLPDATHTLAFTSPRHLAATQALLGLPRHLFAWDCRAALRRSDRLPMMRLKLCLWYGPERAFSLDRARYWLGDERTGRGKRLQELFVEDGCSISQVVERRGHPYAKPLPWIEGLLRGVSMVGPVYDPFGGSGTTLLACEAFGRSSATVESDPAHVELILDHCRARGMTVGEQEARR